MMDTNDALTAEKRPACVLLDSVFSAGEQIV